MVKQGTLRTTGRRLTGIKMRTQVAPTGALEEKLHTDKQCLETIKANVIDYDERIMLMRMLGLGLPPGVSGSYWDTRTKHLSKARTQQIISGERKK